MHLKVCRSATEVLDILSKNDEIWEVSHKFNSGILFTCGTSGIFMGTLNASPGPYHVSLSLSDFNLLMSLVDVGSLIHMNREKKSCFCCKELNLDFQETFFYKSQIDMSIDIILKDQVEFLKKFILESPIKNGLGLDVYELCDYCFELLKSDKKERLESNLEVFISFFIGKGNGLTPSGDDFLIGFLSVFSKWELLKSILLKKINSDELTTKVSYLYYRSALSGKFDWNIVLYLSSLLQSDFDKQLDYLKKISNYGHSSGIDLLTGIYVALCLKTIEGVK